MTMDFADAMRAAMNLTLDQKLIEATRVIQSALSGEESVPSRSPSKSAITSLAIENHVIDLTAEAIEPETMVSAEVTADTPSEQSQPSRIAPWTADLSEALTRLRHTELPSLHCDGLAGLRPRKALQIPDGAQFLSRSFVCAAGSRNYKLYVPCRSHTGKRALLVMLHGGTQDANDF